MKKFILGCMTGFAATIFAAKLRLRHLKKHHAIVRHDSRKDLAMERSAMLIHWLMTAPGLGITVEQIADHYYRETAIIDSILTEKD